MELLFPKATAKQRANLIYGTKLRYIMCMRGQMAALLKMVPDALTVDQQRVIQEILEDAIRQAKQERDDELRKASTSSGVTSESRQYSGK